MPAPANGDTDMAVEQVRLALMGVNHSHPGGAVLPVDAAANRPAGVK